MVRCRAGQGWPRIAGHRWSVARDRRPGQPGVVGGDRQAPPSASTPASARSAPTPGWTGAGGRAAHGGRTRCGAGRTRAAALLRLRRHRTIRCSPGGTGGAHPRLPWATTGEIRGLPVPEPAIASGSSGCGPFRSWRALRGAPRSGHARVSRCWRSSASSSTKATPPPARRTRRGCARGAAPGAGAGGLLPAGQRPGLSADGAAGLTLKARSDDGRRGITARSGPGRWDHPPHPARMEALARAESSPRGRGRTCRQAWPPPPRARGGGPRHGAGSRAVRGAGSVEPSRWWAQPARWRSAWPKVRRGWHWWTRGRRPAIRRCHLLPSVRGDLTLQLTAERAGAGSSRPPPDEDERTLLRARAARCQAEA